MKGKARHCGNLPQTCRLAYTCWTFEVLNSAECEDDRYEDVQSERDVHQIPRAMASQEADSITAASVVRIRHGFARAYFPIT